MSRSAPERAGRGLLGEVEYPRRSFPRSEIVQARVQQAGLAIRWTSRHPRTPLPDPTTEQSHPSAPRKPRHFVVVLNEEAGTVVRLGRDEVVDTLVRVFEEGGIRLTLHAVKACDLQDRLKEAVVSEADVLIVGGGDGTVAAAATLLAAQSKHHSMAMGVLPLGTFNLAARDLGMPLDMEQAARALTTAPIAPMDAMELNGRLYLCLMVLGFYPAFKMARPEHHGWWLIRAFHTLCDSLRHAATFPRLHLTLVQDGKPIQCRTRVVLIANNDYEDVFGVIPRRASLNAGYFTVYLSRHRTRFGMFRSFLAWVLGFWKEDREVSRLQTTELEIHARRQRTLPIMMDGEVERLRLPLKITLRPGVLKILAPREAAGREA